ncbi:endonuclease/exonuclease/phosphatase family protein [Microbacterium sp. DT81.1]|uniref:endonuclease/exonuclease/phosphatase family protein n=1 Tax=Microbacterium sp. DT81.1 TaxID=3393413 RepID=UPI003CF0B9C5
MPGDALIGPVEPPDLHVMTYNIRRRAARVSPRSPDYGPRRRPLLRAILQRELPTIVGIQEAMPDQVAFVADVLGPAYRAVGRGRNPDGSDERCAILYDTRRIALERWSQLALSDTPDVAGSRTWGNLLPRMLVSANLIDTATGIPFRVLNAHLDHLSRAARARSAEMIVDLVRRSDLPTLVLGDMNSDTRSAPYRTLTSGPLRAAWTAARVRLTPEWDTFSRYRAPKTGGKRIDWILVSDAVTVDAVGINAVRFDGAAASDHEPVQARIRFESTALP